MSEDWRSRLIDMPHREYLRDQFDGPLMPPALSRSIAHTLLTRSPFHAKRQHPRLGGHYDDPTDAMVFGTAIHELVLLGGFESIVPLQHDDFRSKAAREEREAVRAAGKNAVPERKLKRASVVADGIVEFLRRPAVVAEIGAWDHTEALSERTIRWQHNGVLCKSRPDWIRRDGLMLLDLKCVEGSARPEAWGRNVTSMGYHLQVAWCLRAMTALTGLQPAFVFLVAETEAPYGISLVGLEPELVDLGMRQMDEAAARWGECLASGAWPSYPETVVFAPPNPWDLATLARYEQMR